MKKNILITNKLRVAITNACNLSCFYCHNEGQGYGGKKTFMPLSKVKTMCKWFKDHNVYTEVVNITGGEPLLHPEICEIVSEFNTITKEIHLNTNATLLDKEKILMLKECGVHDLKIGLDSIYTEQTKPTLCHCMVSPEDILSNIDYATTIMGVELNAVLTRHNYAEIDKLIEWSFGSRVKSLKIIQLNDFNPFHMNDNDKSPLAYKTNDATIYNLFYDVRDKYLAKAYHYDCYPSKGRVSVYLRREDGSEFNLLFCEDVCASAACGNMFTEIDSNGDLMICPRYQRTVPIDFEQDFDSVCATLNYGKKSMCNSFTGIYTLRENHGQLSRSI